MYKIFIIDEVHMLSIGAFNALLKTLEEPPSYVIFILATTEVHKIPVTILSRCQRYDFKRISIETISARLMELIEKERGLVFVKGNRKGRPLFDVFFTVGMSVFETCYLHAKLYDINAQPNIFPKIFYDEWQEPPHDFSLDLYALYTARKKGLKVLRFPVVFPERVHGTSKWNTGLAAKWKFIKRTITFSVKLKKSGSLQS